MQIHGWGRYQPIEAEILLPQTNQECSGLVQKLRPLIARGLGRSYGDSASYSTVIQTTYLNHFLEFDSTNGTLMCEAGISLREIMRLVVPHGWTLPVTPGSSFVTVGGAISSDVHGKNHHTYGTFSEYVHSIILVLGSGQRVTVSRTSLPDLFRATCGGMGLTGVIFSASLQLERIHSSNIIQTTIKSDCLEDVCEQFDNNQESTYSVAWIDCLTGGKKLGRSLLILGEYARDNVLNLIKLNQHNLHFDMPGGFLNHYSIKAFNSLYYHKAPSEKKSKLVPFESFFYPLDAIGNWNRLYGKKGFVQYQFVLPKEVGVAGLRLIIQTIVASRKGSFLAVLKVFGKANKNILSFPIEGYTLALDFKLDVDTLKLLRKLDHMVADLGGRIYLAKDALMTEEIFKQTYVDWFEFEEVRSKYGAIGKFASNQSKRLGLQ